MPQTSAPAQTEIQIGQALPAFTAQATGEQTVSNDSLIGKNVVIYFYPKDNTPGCTTEGQNFRDAHAEFEAANTVVYGVSPDTLRTHENFKAKHGFPFELISDPEHVLAELLNVWQLKKLYGREYMGIVRSTFLFDSEGTLRDFWSKVKVKGHVDEVLTAAQAL